MAGGAVVEDDDAVSGLQQTRSADTAHVAGAAGDQHSHDGS
ncbi:hypothetical protein ACIRU3_38720 [Streptomyces sp. NPDC101151]